MRLPDPSPVLDKNRAPMGPEILSSTGAGVWRKAPMAIPDPSSVQDEFQSARCAKKLSDAAFLLTVGSFLLTVELFCLQLTNLAFILTVGAFLLTILALFLTVGAFLTYNGKVRLIRALRDCKQRSLTVSKINSSCK